MFKLFFFSFVIYCCYTFILFCIFLLSADVSLVVVDVLIGVVFVVI